MVCVSAHNYWRKLVNCDSEILLRHFDKISLIFILHFRPTRYAHNIHTLVKRRRLGSVVMPGRECFSWRSNTLVYWWYQSNGYSCIQYLRSVRPKIWHKKYPGLCCNERRQQEDGHMWSTSPISKFKDPERTWYIM